VNRLVTGGGLGEGGQNLRHHRGSTATETIEDEHVTIEKSS